MINANLNKIEKMNLEKVHLFLNKFKKKKRIINDLSYYAEIGKISSGIFHDLLSPITSLSLLMENSNQINQEKYIKYLNESNKELRDFIISLNDFIKNKSTNKYFYIDEKVRSVIKLVNYRIIKNNLSVKLISESKIKVYGSDLKLQQVILNLISNSIDSYTDHTGNKKEINISIYKTKRNVFIKIQDYGCGIDKKMKDKIFNLYQSTKSEGFGIGLHTVKSIIENDFKGKIICSSSKETGTTFTITIPT